MPNFESIELAASAIDRAAVESGLSAKLIEEIAQSESRFAKPMAEVAQSLHIPLPHVTELADGSVVNQWASPTSLGNAFDDLTVTKVTHGPQGTGAWIFENPMGLLNSGQTKIARLPNLMRTEEWSGPINLGKYFDSMTVTRIAHGPNGSFPQMFENPEGIFGPGTQTRITRTLGQQIEDFAKPYKIKSGPLEEALVTKVVSHDGLITGVENPQGIFGPGTAIKLHRGLRGGRFIEEFT